MIKQESLPPTQPDAVIKVGRSTSHIFDIRQSLDQARVKPVVLHDKQDFPIPFERAMVTATQIDPEKALAFDAKISFIPSPKTDTLLQHELPQHFQEANRSDSFTIRAITFEPTKISNLYALTHVDGSRHLLFIDAARHEIILSNNYRVISNDQTEAVTLPDADPAYEVADFKRFVTAYTAVLDVLTRTSEWTGTLVEEPLSRPYIIRPVEYKPRPPFNQNLHGNV